MKYFVSIGDRTIAIDVDGEVVHVDGRRTEVQFEDLPGTPEIRVVIDGVASTVAVDSEQGTLWRLLDRGAVREVTVEDERSRHIRMLAGSGRVADGHAALRAPMPGLVLRIFVAAGDRVTSGTPLLALEAMKMENELKAAGPGVVTSVLVTAGQAVEKGQKLLELQPPAPPSS